MLCPQLLVLLWITRLMMKLILPLKLLSLLMLQQLLLPLHVIRMLHFPTAVCYMHAALLPAPVIPAPVPDLRCTSHDAMLRPCFRRPAADWPEHPGDRLVHPGLRPVHQLGVAALLPLPRHRLTLLGEKKYILEKIQQANRELRDQEAPDMTRHRRLHFKATLVDLVVPPLQNGNTGEVEGAQGNKDSEAETEVSGKLSELKLSPREESRGSGRAGESSEGGVKEGRVLVEKDGKFDLVSLKEVESQGLLPPIANNYSDSSSPRHPEQTVSSGKTHMSSSSHPRAGIDHLRAPRPPSQPRTRPSSASHGQRGSQRRDSKRRVQSATGTPCQATYFLSPQQKELLQRIQERKEMLAREEEQRKQEEAEQKRQENELAFKAWLLKKRGQSEEEKRIHRAQEMESRNSKKDSGDPEESYRLWLQRKQEQQQKERQLVELKRLEEDSSYLLRSREECERAFKLWLKRKRAEKRAQQQAARERSRRLVLDERRERRMRDLLCTVNETKPFRFKENLAHHF